MMKGMAACRRPEGFAMAMWKKKAPDKPVRGQ
jgi:hypothetical protein